MEFGQAISVLAALNRHGVLYVLVGSMAMAAQGIIRATRDMDVAQILKERFGLEEN